MKTITKKTTYEGHDGVTYEAVAKLTIEDDGQQWISIYDYYDPQYKVWIETEERDWDQEEIKNLFGV